MNKIIIKVIMITCFGLLWSQATAYADTYYISPTGNDSRIGTSTSTAWATFNRAWQTLEAGDTLILMDGTYYQTMQPTVAGTANQQIIIRAQHDGKAIIDGQNIRTPVHISNWEGASHLVIEGIVARNSSGTVFSINSPYNTLRRVSGYNANTDTNDHVFSIWTDYTLIEDCVASGTGRKMIMVYQGDNNTIRRCFARWERHDSREYCDPWPWGDGIQIYIGNNNTIENSIVDGPLSGWGISIQANGPRDETYVVGNQILGSMALRAGMNEDLSVKDWGSTRPGPTSCTEIRDFAWQAQRAGFGIWGPGDTRDNLFQDILVWGNAGLGFSVEGVDKYQNAKLNRATIINNGLGLWDGHIDGSQGTNVKRLSHLDITNSVIGGTSFTGEGAHLTTRYIDRVQTNQSLWPWPMEQRIRDELGLSVTNLIASIIPDQVNPIDGPIPTFVPTPTPTPLPPITATPTGLPPSTSTPHPSQTILIPGRLEMESYTNYFDQSSGNVYASEAPSYTDDVDIRATTDQNGGYKLAGIEPGEWLEYIIDVKKPGTYSLIARIASDDQEIIKQFQVIIDEDIAPRSRSLTFAPVYSGGWDTFIDIAIDDISLTSGVHTVRLALETGWFDLNYINFVLRSPSDTPTPTAVSTRTPTPTGTPSPTTTPSPSATPGGGTAQLPTPSASDPKVFLPAIQN